MWHRQARREDTAFTLELAATRIDYRRNALGRVSEAQADDGGSPVDQVVGAVAKGELVKRIDKVLS